MKKIFVVFGIIFLYSFLFIACDPEPSGVDVVLRRATTSLVHPGILHTQEEFMAMRKLIDRWEGIGRDYTAFDGVTWNVPPQVPVGPPSDREMTPQEFVESQGGRFFDRPENSPICPNAIAEYREYRAQRRRMFAEYRAWRSYRDFITHPAGSLAPWTERRFEFIGRCGPVSGTKTPVEQDFQRAYFNAVRWVLTGDRRHAQLAFFILDSYARHLVGFQHAGMYDFMLMVGLQGHLYAATAEILRFARCTVYNQDSGFIPEQFHNIDRSIRNIWLRHVIRDYIELPPWRAGNQGTMIQAAYIAMAIYLDDPALFDHAIDFLVNAYSEANIKHYIHHVSGQVGEATRTQGYVMLALSKIGMSADMAWRQGVDVWGSHNNTLWRASEFASRYNMGDNNITTTTMLVFDPFSPVFFFDNTWDYQRFGYGWELTQMNRGYPFKGGELFYNHFVRRRGKQMPWTEAWLPLPGDPTFSDFWAVDDSPPGFVSFLGVPLELSRELGLWQ